MGFSDGPRSRGMLRLTAKSLCLDKDNNVYLNMLTVEQSNLAAAPKEPPFRWLSYHVKEVFMAFLPKRFQLNDTTKLQITCGPRGGEPQYLEVLGTSEYYVEDFDFAHFYAVQGRERDDFLLDVIESCLVDIDNKRQLDPTTAGCITSTVAKVREEDFCFSREVKKLSRSTPCRKLRFIVSRHLNRDVGEGWSIDITKRNKEVLDRQWIGDVPDFLDRTEQYRLSRWIEDSFQIVDPFARVVCEVDARPYLDRL
mgnify:CR=1 FL=1